MSLIARTILTFILVCALRVDTKTDVQSEDNVQNLGRAQARTWADSIYQTLTIDERIGQLIMIRAHSDLGLEHEEKVRNLIEKYKVGSLCFFQGTPRRQLELTNDYQSRSKIPLIVSMDAEWGLGMRHKEDAMSFPKQMALGAVQDNELIYNMGREIGRQLRRIGTHLNFAPVIDVNNNKNNPVINDRSFGERQRDVTEKGTMYMLGLQQEGVMACAKHFPGHGDTDVDSHYDLPVINHDMNRLDSVELRPFQRLIARGVQSIMVAHMNVPAIDNEQNKPTTLSKKTITDLLKNQMGFDGLIITDAMEMKGVTKHYKAGEAEAIAIAAGNDILCLPVDVPKAIEAIKAYLTDGKISENRLAESVKKILAAKYRLGLTNYIPITTNNLEDELFSAYAQKLNRELLEKSLTLARDERGFIPIKNTEGIALLDIGINQRTSFQRRMQHYGLQSMYRISKGGGTEKLMQKLGNKKHVIVAFHDMSSSPKKGFGIYHEDVTWVKQLADKTNVTIVLFGNPYALQYFDEIGSAVVAYNDDHETQNLLAQALMGAREFSGKLPVTASLQSRGNQGRATSSLFRLGFAQPEDVGMSSNRLEALDTLMAEIIERKAAPGGQILVIKDGKVVVQRAYGYHTYEKKNKVENHHVYDLASITKILASTYSLMDLFDKGKISVFKPVSNYIPEIKKTDKKEIVIEDMLIHSARLKPWIPFYKNTLNAKNKPSLKWYNKEKETPFTLEVANDLYMHKSYLDSIWHHIFESELRHTPGYRYSDLGFYLADRIVKEVSGKPIDKFTAEEFYLPLGLNRTMYNPLQKLPQSEIVPTEEDTYFRHQRLQGHVHDMGAAMRGGVSGHAGLFSNAYEVGILMQNLLNGGYYGGTRYFHPVTVSLFTARPEGETRRGLGFDMKQLDPSKKGNMASEASYKTFGHLGFTGTCAWADPLNNLVFVFLSNRTYPSMENNLLGKDDYRPRLQSIVYGAIVEE